MKNSKYLLIALLSLVFIFTNVSNADEVANFKTGNNSDINVNGSLSVEGVPMNKQEVIRDLAFRENISFAEAQQKLFPNEDSSSLRTFSTKEDEGQYVVLSGLPENDQMIYSHLGKLGKVYFYCYTTEGQNFRAIKLIVYAGYNTGDKVFSGRFHYALPDPNRIHYTLDGGLYSNTSVTTSGGGNVSLYEFAEINASVSSTTSYIRDVFIDMDVKY